MIKAIMAIDDLGGVSKNGTMPWPKNSKDLIWFKKNTLNNVVIMGSKTWIDPLMPSPLKNRVNVLITSKDKKNYPGADEYVSDDLINSIKKIDKKYIDKEKFIIGGPNILDQLFELIDVFYLTRIYGNFNCDTRLNLEKIESKLTLEKKISINDLSHCEIWKK